MINTAVVRPVKLSVFANLKAFLFSESNEVHYIGGSDVLPPPLQQTEETEAIEKLGTAGEETAKNLLIEHNLRLVVYIIFET